MSKQTITSPIGVAVYPRLTKPDTKFVEEGIYKADIRVPSKEAEPFMKMLTEAYKAHTGKAPNKMDNPLWVVEQDDEGNATGTVLFKMRVKNRTTKRGDLWDRKPKLFDAQLNPLNGVEPWGGTEMRVSCEVYAWTAGAKKGVSLQPQAVQIIKLVEGSGGDASGFGFDATEGFVGESNPFDTEDDAETSKEDF